MRYSTLACSWLHVVFGWLEIRGYCKLLEKDNVGQRKFEGRERYLYFQGTWRLLGRVGLPCMVSGIRTVLEGKVGRAAVETVAWSAV